MLLAVHILDREGIPSNETCQNVVAANHTAGASDEEL